MGRADILSALLAKIEDGAVRFGIFLPRGGAVAARRAHNPKVVSSNLTRATKLRRLTPMFGAIAAVLIAACGSTSDQPPNGPYASPRQSPPQVVLSRVCDAQTPANKNADTQFMQILLIRQGTDLGRVSDDLTGAVPGGNFPVDAAAGPPRRHRPQDPGRDVPPLRASQEPHQRRPPRADRRRRCPRQQRRQRGRRHRPAAGTGQIPGAGQPGQQPPSRVSLALASG